MMTFLHKYFLLLIPVVMILFLIRKKQLALKFSYVKAIKKKGKKRLRYKFGKFVVFLSIVALIIALARPRTPASVVSLPGQGIDIAIVVDTSNSMESIDFDPNRLEVAKDTILKFIDKRENDRIALVVFSAEAFTTIPLTLDHDMVKKAVKDLNVDMVEKEGTAVGMGIAVGINRLKNSDAASKVIILITDGDNNAGTIDPLTASNLAKEMDMKIYAIGVGTDDMILPDGFGGYDYYEGGFDEALLEEVAEITGGDYFRAQDEKALDRIFDKIDDLEKTDFDRIEYHEYNEWAFLFIKIALAIMVIGIFFDRYYYIQIP